MDFNQVLVGPLGRCSGPPEDRTDSTPYTAAASPHRCSLLIAVAPCRGLPRRPFLRHHSTLVSELSSLRDFQCD